MKDSLNSVQQMVDVPVPGIVSRLGHTHAKWKTKNNSWRKAAF